MTGAAQSDREQEFREQEFRADVARLVQAMRHHLPARNVPPEAVPLIEPARHLAVLLNAGAPTDHLQEAALAVVNIYEWPNPQASSGGEGPVIDPAILAAVERLRAAVDAMETSEQETSEQETGEQETGEQETGRLETGAHDR